MKKLSLILNLIFLFAFNLLAFVIPFNRDTIFVINLISVNITMILNLLFIIIYMNSKQKTKNRFLNLSILNLNYIFICLAIIIFIIFNIIPITKLWIPLTIDIILIMAIVVINTCLNKSVKYIEDYDKKVKQNKKYLNLIQLEVELLFQKELNLDVKNKLKELLDVIKYSDPMSVEEVKDLELVISNKIEYLKKSEFDLDTIGEIKELLIERNKKIKILK